MPWAIVAQLALQGSSGPAGPQGQPGATGPPGPSGNAIFTGRNAPTQAQGRVNDLYIMLPGGNVYQKQQPADLFVPGWVLLGNISVGPAGPAGPPGVKGSTGPPGPPGLTPLLAPNSGGSLPFAPNVGDAFLWQPGGRTWFMIWDGTAWNPIQSIGATTLYVDTALGTDTQQAGFAAGANAYKTINYAVQQLPPTLGGNVVMNVAAGTYNETVVIQGLSFTGNFTVTIQGVKAADSLGPTTASSGSNPVGNGSAGFGTVTKTGATWTVDAWQNLFVEITSGTGAGQIYPVHTNTATVLTIVGRWATVPDATSIFHVYDLATIVNGASVRNYCFDIAASQIGIVLTQLKITNAAVEGVHVIQGQCDVTFCRFDGNLIHAIYATLASANNYNFNVHTTSGFADLYIVGHCYINLVKNCRFTSAAANPCIFCSSSTLNVLQECYAKTTGGFGIQVLLGGTMFLEDYLEVDGCLNDNISVQGFSVCQANAIVNSTIRSINSVGWGCNCDPAGLGQGMQGITYIANTAGNFNPITAFHGATS